MTTDIRKTTVTADFTGERHENLSRHGDGLVNGYVDTLVEGAAREGSAPEAAREKYEEMLQGRDLHSTAMTRDALRRRGY